MPQQKRAASDFVKQMLDKFPSAATRTIATSAYESEPTLWPSASACLLAFRRARGQQGNKQRDKSADKSHFREPSNCRGFSPMPAGITSLSDWKPFQIDDVGLWLVISDIHAPYHTADAIVAACKLARLRKVVGILLNGDIADCFAVSRWETDPRKRNFKHEVETVRSLLLFIRSRFPDARIVYKWGNHEERYDAYQQVKAPHTLGIDDYEFESVMRVRANGIETVKNMQPIKLGKLFVLHGHEYRFAIQNPVNPARGLFLRSQVSAMCGHFHQTSQHSEKNLAEHVTSTWSTGCMCDLHPEYMPLNKWNVGCAFVHVFRDGAFDVNNSRIVDGKVWA